MTTTTIKNSKEVSLSGMNWFDNNRMEINYREDLWVRVIYGISEVTVYYFSRRMDNSNIPSCCKAPGKYKNIKSAETQIKKFFRNW